MPDRMVGGRRNMQNDLGIPDIFFVVLPIIAGTLFCGGALLFRRHGREMREHGVGTRATVLKKFKKGSGLENGYALLAYTDNTGRQIQAEVWVHSRSWHGLKEGGQTDICYVPGKPEAISQGCAPQKVSASQNRVPVTFCNVRS